MTIEFKTKRTLDDGCGPIQTDWEVAPPPPRESGVLATQPETTAREWFVRADREFWDAVSRLSTLHGGVGDRPDWALFREEAADLVVRAEQRHAAKHAAVQEIERDASYTIVGPVCASCTGHHPGRWCDGQVKT